MSTLSASPDPASMPSTGTASDLPRSRLAAVLGLFSLCLRQTASSRRLILIAFLLLLPVGLAGLARYYDTDGFADDQLTHWQPQEAEFQLLFMMFPHALLPLTALVFSAGLVQDEIEEQTLTYLLVRPLPKWGILLAKLSAAVLIAWLLTTISIALTLGALYWGLPGFWGEVIPVRLLKATGLIGLALTAYSSTFALVGLVVKRALALGVAYIILFEGIFANIDFVIRRCTIMYYFRVLGSRWMNLDAREWRIDLPEAPSSLTCVLLILAAAALTAGVAAILFTTREFRLKTPEGT